MASTISQEQMAYAAAVCGKYCSKVAALTTWDTADEPVRCDTCIHWNGGPCSKMASFINEGQRERL
ncbi:MAG: hypothetical protein ACOYEH_05445 [Caldicoprobacterales bacterium]|nr:hypothetical protein [Clostridiales bacterium]